MARCKGGSLLSARRSKRDEISSESSSEEDHDRATLFGFSFGGCEHRATASLLIFEILSKEAPKVNVTADDIEFLRENGGNTWNSFVADRHINSGITYIVSFHII